MSPPRLIIRDVALEDVDAIANYIAADNVDAGLRFYDAAQAAFDLLATTAGAGPRVEPPVQAVPHLASGRSLISATTLSCIDRSGTASRSSG